MKVALWIGAAMLAMAVPPIWPYTYYQVLRLVVRGVALYALYELRDRTAGAKGFMLIIAALFNPVVPAHLPKAVWVFVDLATAGVFVVTARMDWGGPKPED